MNKILLTLIAFHFIGCSTSSIDKETLADLTEALNCETITTGWSTHYDTNEGSKKTFTITVHEPRNLNINNEQELREPSIYLVSSMFNDLSKIDTSYTDFHVVYSIGNDKSTIAFALDELYSAIGMNYYTNMNLVMGIYYLNQAIKWNPLNSTHYNNRGIINYSLKDYENASLDFKKANELEPSNPEILRALASSYMEMNNLKYAKEIIEKSITLDPNYSSPYAVRARIYKRSLQLDSSILDFKKAISLDASPTNWYKELGEVYFENNEFGNALETLQDYLVREPEDGLGYLLKGRIFLKMKNNKSACSDFDRALELGVSDAQEYISKICGR